MIDIQDPHQLAAPPPFEGKSLETPDSKEISAILKFVHGKLEVLDSEKSFQRKMQETDIINARFQEALILPYIAHLNPEERVLYKENCDPMTGHFERRGLAELDRMIQQEKTISIASYDADHFQSINKVLGRTFGDLMIKVIGKHFHYLAHELRQEGYRIQVVRMGGEEFTVFGNAPQERLTQAMKDLSQRVKHEICSLIPQEKVEAMAEEIFHSKYKDKGGTLHQARQEIGGSTANVVSVETETLKENPKARAHLLEFTDHFLELNKNSGGRGQVYGPTYSERIESGEVIEKSMSSYRVAERIRNFTPDNMLGDEQSKQFKVLEEELAIKVEEQFMEHCPDYRKIIMNVSDQKKKRALQSVLESPNVSEEDIRGIAQELNMYPEAILSLKQEFITAKREVASYTGAASMQKLNKAIAQAKSGFLEKNRRRISINAFKSFNESIGHSNADIFLTFIYQEVLLDTVKKFGIPSNKIIISQKGADFFFVLHESIADLCPDFSEQIQIRYEQALLGLNQRIGKSQGEHHPPEEHRLHKRREKPAGSFLSIRERWLKAHTQSDLSDIYQLTIQS